MEIKKIIFFVLIILAIISGIIFLLFGGVETQISEEYIPIQEVTEEQERQTSIYLFFENKENKQIEVDEQYIDVKLLAENPYLQIMNLLLKGPSNENLIRLIPNGTKINSVNINGNTVNIDFSKEFLENQIDDIEVQQKTITSIVKSLTQLNEVKFVKISIEGNSETGFQEIKFNEKFSL